MATFNDAREAAEVLKAHLVSTLADEPHATTFSEFNGAQVFFEDEYPPPQRESLEPYIMLTMQPSEDAGETWGNGAWRARVQADVVAGGHSGALLATGSDTLLSRALKTIIREGYATLRDAGLYASKVADPNETNTSDETGHTHTNRHVIEFIYFDA